MPSAGQVTGQVVNFVRFCSEHVHSLIVGGSVKTLQNKSLSLTLSRQALRPSWSCRSWRLVACDCRGSEHVHSLIHSLIVGGSVRTFQKPPSSPRQFRLKQHAHAWRWIGGSACDSSTSFARKPWPGPELASSFFPQAQSWLRPPSFSTSRRYRSNALPSR